MRATNPAFSARFMMAMVISKLLNRNSSGPSRFTQKNNGAIAVRQFCSVRKWPLLAAFGCPRDQPGHGYLEHSDCDSEPCARGESHRQTARLALVAANQFAFLSWPRDVAAARDYAEHDEFAGIRPEFSIGLADAFARRRGLSHVAHRANPGNARDAVSVLSSWRNRACGRGRRCHCLFQWLACAGGNWLGDDRLRERGCFLHFAGEMATAPRRPA